MKKKFIFITGGVVSSLGKGIASASIGRLLASRGIPVALAKFDPYLNVDPGTMNPYQHGEVFVLDDGAETDLDLGHYERFLSRSLNKNHNVTAGKIYHSVILKERRGDYLGKTVQVVPHVIQEIQEAIFRAAEGETQVCVVEIGGTVGDIESLPFLEAIRQFQFQVGRENVLYVHLTLVPYISTAGELKTKPTQQTIAALRAIGIQPDLILCRTNQPLGPDIKAKISLFCNVPPSAVFDAVDVDSIYEVPLRFQKQRLDELLLRKLNIRKKPSHMQNWERFVQRQRKLKKEVEIAVCGKYVALPDAYKSINEAFVHAGVAAGIRVRVRWVDTEEVEKKGALSLLKGVSGVLVPGGFGDRGIEGKISVARLAREKKIPYFGICLGMQCAVIEFARHVAGLKKAHSTEFDPTAPHPVIALMEEQTKVTAKGGTMRLGAYPCQLVRLSRAYQAYRKTLIYERHRHRYEFNNIYRERLARAGLRFSGLSPDRRLVEIVEIPKHPWFLGCQFHPELKSRPLQPHPLFVKFLQAAAHFRSRKGRL